MDFDQLGREFGQISVIIGICSIMLAAAIRSHLRDRANAKELERIFQEIDKENQDAKNSGM